MYNYAYLKNNNYKLIYSKAFKKKKNTEYFKIRFLLKIF